MEGHPRLIYCMIIIQGGSQMITITIGNLIGALALAFTIGLSVAYWLWDPSSPRKR
jgi:hypothetical protein